jgi:hypothetical protein
MRNQQPPVWDELPDRDPLVTDMLELPDPLSPEEGALHIIGEPSYDEREMDDVMEEIADDRNP